MFYGKFQTAVNPNVGPVLGVVPTYTKDYGANWATTATRDADLADAVKYFPMAILKNTNATGGGVRVFFHDGAAWHGMTANLS